MRKRLAGVGFRIAALLALLTILPVAAGYATPAGTGYAANQYPGRQSNPAVMQPRPDTRPSGVG